MKRFYYQIGLSLVVLVSASMVGIAKGELVGKSIATVNGEAIFLTEFKNNWNAFLDQHNRLAPQDKVTDEWKKEQKETLLDQMIEEKLLLQEAKRQHVKVQKRQLEEGIRQVQNRFKRLAPGKRPTKEDYDRELTKEEKSDFLKELKDQDLTEKEFEKKIEDQLRIVRLTEIEIKSKVEPPVKNAGESEPREISPAYEKEARALFKKIKAKIDSKSFKPDPKDEIDQMAVLIKNRFGEAVRASHILIKSSRNDDFKKRSAALRKIRDIQNQIKAGGDFEELAEKYSEGPSAKNGGDLGTFSRGQMVPEFEKTAFSLPVGKVSDVVETEYGYHLILVTEKKAAKKLRFDDVKFDLASYLYQKKGQKRYDEYVKGLRKKADIKITLDSKDFDDI